MARAPRPRIGAVHLPERDAPRRAPAPGRFRLPYPKISSGSSIKRLSATADPSMHRENNILRAKCQH